ncbi:MAG: endonuclease III [Clostridia bacterium]|nr:endonuclease III [Clostridia bacterium]MDD3862652.1 endonuclease III [Clostridia bacterium]
MEYWDELFSKPTTELKFSNNFELLIAVLLSAQCTDKRVNAVTENLFKKYKTPQDFSKLSQQELEKEIYSCGFYRKKSKSIINISREIIDKHDGKVPNTIEKLKSLNGIGQKTASVIFSIGFGGDAIAVDTHVLRVSKRLGFSNAENVKKCEEDLKKLIDKSLWSKTNSQMVLFGRYYCKARSPKCETCKLKEICKYKLEQN